MPFQLVQTCSRESWLRLMADLLFLIFRPHGRREQTNLNYLSIIKLPIEKIRFDTSFTGYLRATAPTTAIVMLPAPITANSVLTAVGHARAACPTLLMCHSPYKVL
ncbi:hypothetical protein J6590_010813 [Homalodisca vitripennis]|nr:hypothetical protein J6590_010813 [Homalodisca vitripennis]